MPKPTAAASLEHHVRLGLVLHQVPAQDRGGGCWLGTNRVGKASVVWAAPSNYAWAQLADLLPTCLN